MAWNIKRWAIGYGMLGTFRLGGPKAFHAPAWKSAAWVLIGLAFSRSAHAAPEMGPSSSASIRISMSVAPRYALRPATGTLNVRLKHADPSQFCLETNVTTPHLPVMLIWLPEHEVSASGLIAKENTVEVPPCGAHRGMFQAVSRRNQVASGMLIVRPE